MPAFARVLKPRALIAVLIFAISVVGLGREAEGLPTSRWTGSVTCTVTTQGTDKNGNAYSDQQVHTWAIFPVLITSQGSFTFYSATWTVSGRGSVGPLSWAYNGRVFNYIQFVDVNGDLHISTGPNVCDLTGTTVSDGTTDNICEQQFSTIIVSGNPTHVQGTVPVIVPAATKIGHAEPGGSTHMEACSWDFNYGIILLQPLPRPREKPQRP